jgi:vacuolar-type H+-ATPase subunit E/Vma4
VKSLGSVAAVVEALREEAEGEVQRIARETEERIAQLRAAAGAEPADLPDRGPRLAAARRGAAELLAQEAWADRRAMLEEREAWIGRIVAEGQRRLEAPEPPSDRRDLLGRLAAEAAACLPGEACEIVVAPADAALLDEAWCKEVAKAAGKKNARVVPDAARRGGCLARAEGGKVSFDNGFEARARRFEPAWRAGLAGIYGP